MLEIRLTLPATALLKEVAKKRGIKTDGMLHDDGVWRLTDDDRGRLVDAISSDFALTGLRSDDEPNKRGLELEALLDRINKLK